MSRSPEEKPDELAGGNRQDNRYRSRTLWMIVFFTILATALTYTDKIEGAGWVTVILALFAGWQGRRYADNRLHANGGK